MIFWCVVILPMVMGGLIANDSIENNLDIPFELTMTLVESRILEQLEKLSRTFGEEAKTINEKIDQLKRDTQSIQETNIMFNTTQQLMEKLSQQLQTASKSTEQRLTDLEHRLLDQLPEQSGVYFMQPDPAKNASFEVLRDWTNNHGFGGNWIVFQRRFNGSVNFYRNWTEYRQGFGELHGEHWLGLDKLHAIVSTRQHELLIVLEDFDGVVAYAHYDDFKIGNESEKYVIKSVGQYSGTAGDSFSPHKDEAFSTHDQDNDKHKTNCAEWVRGAWWFYKCHQSHLNGEYLRGKIDKQEGIMWLRFRGSYYSLKSTKMMVRPVA
ncbi:microfibril-associated glycoprotein 4-like [Anopheles arabiensis]|uniref:AGAP012000-PA n=2 Tax=gambiae species complex TaxID=44542 RepID=Q7PZN3_ANOGA|nr:microfibril-associated glycoprotein 4-like [Anopheles arabiensis]EAA00222.4 AGAP012000-PA [Anopheles gambiae str. PEST]